MYKVFYEDRLITFCTALSKEQLQANYLLYHFENFRQLTSITDQFLTTDSQIDICVICSELLEEVFQAFLNHFRLVVTAGGIIADTSGRFLFIFRNEKWDLPKGHIDEGESLEQCALREVVEETGLSKLRLIKPIGITRHLFALKGQFLLKQNHWYLMTGDSEQRLTLATDEGITDAHWVNKSKLDDYLALSYRSIRHTLGPLMKEIVIG